LDYDGTERHTLEVSSVNQTLIYQIRQILLDHDIWNTCNLSSANKRKGFRQQWRLDIQYWKGINRLVEKSLKFKPFTSDKLQKRNFILKEEGYWCTIKKIKKIEFEGPVFNLEVEEDHSYTVKHIATHNCIAFAITLLASKSNTNRGIMVNNSSVMKKAEKAVNYNKALVNGYLQQTTKIRNPFLR